MWIPFSDQAKKQSTKNGSPKTGDAVEEKLIEKALQDPEPELVLDKDNGALSREVEGDPSDRLLREVSSEQDHNNETGASKTPVSESLTKAIVKQEGNQDENSGIIDNASISISTSNSELLDGDRIEVQSEPYPSPLPTKEIEVSDADNLNDPGQDTKSTNTDSSSKIDQEGSGPSITNSLVKAEAAVTDADGTVESLTHPKMPPEDKADIPEARVQDQLDEVNLSPPKSEFQCWYIFLVP